MAEIMRIVPDKARQDPETVFATPADIEKHVGLTRGQKLATLRRWEADVTQRLEATAEGMPANDTTLDDFTLLKDIKIVIEAINTGAQPLQEKQ